MPVSAEATLNSRFYVQIDGVVHAVFSEISGLQIETEVFEYREGGNNSFVHRLAGPTRVGNITLKYGLVGSGELFMWYLDVARGKADPRNLSVIVYDAVGNESTRWNFAKAYPVRWVGPTLSADSSAASVETVELAHSGLVEIG